MRLFWGPFSGRLRPRTHALFCMMTHNTMVPYLAARCRLKLSQIEAAGTSEVALVRLPQCNEATKLRIGFESEACSSRRRLVPRSIMAA